MPTHRPPAPSARSSEERAAWLDTLFETSPMGLAVTIDREFIEVNNQICVITGYSRSELIGQTTRLLHVSDAHYRTVGEALYRQLGTQRVARMDTELRRKDGHILDIALCLSLIDPKRPELGAVSTVMDTSAYRHAERLLQARIALSDHAAKGERRALVERVLAEAMALTRSTAARVRFFPADEAIAPCVVEATKGPEEAELRAQASSGCDWARTETAAFDETRPTGGAKAHALPSALGDASLEVVAERQTGAHRGLRLAVGGKAASYAPADRSCLEQLASIAQDAINNLETANALRATETRARLALEAAQDGVWDWDVPSGIVTVNGAYFAMLARGDAGGCLEIAEWRTSVHPQDQPELALRVDRLLGSDLPAEVEYRLRRSDGTWCWVRSRAQVAERDAEGRARRVIGTHADITRVKEAERTAVQARLELETALASMHDAVMISDVGGNLLHLNQAFATFHRFANTANRF